MVPATSNGKSVDTASSQHRIFTVLVLRPSILVLKVIERSVMPSIAQIVAVSDWMQTLLHEPEQQLTCYSLSMNRCNLQLPVGLPKLL